MKTQKPESRRLLQQYNQLIVKNGQLWRVFEDSHGTVMRHQLVVPTSLKTAVLRELHEGTASGHLGEEKTMSRLRERLYWPGQWNDVSVELVLDVLPGKQQLQNRKLLSKPYQLASQCRLLLWIS